MDTSLTLIYKVAQIYNYWKRRKKDKGLEIIWIFNINGTLCFTKAHVLP